MHCSNQQGYKNAHVALTHFKLKYTFQHSRRLLKLFVISRDHAQHELRIVLQILKKADCTISQSSTVPSAFSHEP
jgi:hypothetical protein